MKKKHNRDTSETTFNKEGRLPTKYVKIKN